MSGKDLTYANFESRTGAIGPNGPVTPPSDRWTRSPPPSGTAGRGGDPFGEPRRHPLDDLEPLKVDLSGKVQVGIAAIHNTPTPFEPRFEGFKVYR